MPRISDQTVNEVREAADLVELVRDRVQLVRRGGRWWGPCPFHDETEPSFCLLPDNSRYYCFGCQESGDSITWMNEIEGVTDFVETIEALAERFGVEIRYEETSPQETAKRAASQERNELLERAAAFYAEYLWRADEADEARQYLLDRGYDEEMIRRFRIGYAPGSGTALIQRAAKGGFGTEQLRNAGLSSGQGRDFFTARITFPISDARGRVQGFGARTLDPNQRAKYVNSPESPHFRKRELLFGLDLARSSAARNGWVVVCEGYTDVMGMVASGVEAAVACMGTALTTNQLRTLRRSAQEVRLCFDGDNAGQQAAWRSAEAAKGVPVELSAVRLPPGVDPGELGGTKEGRAQLAEAIDTAEPLVTSLIRGRAARAGRSPRERDHALEEITELLRGMPETVERDEAIRVASSELGLSRGLEERLRTGLLSTETPQRSPAQSDRELSPRMAMERSVLLVGLAVDETIRAAGLASLSAEIFDDETHGRVFSLMTAGVALKDWPPELSGFTTALRAEAVGAATESELQEAVQRLQIDELDRRITTARGGNDEAGLLEALQLRSELRKRLRGEE